MHSWLLFMLLLAVKLCDASSGGHYECGSHGRFEYCIDDIPGCVIGCHCYPGYYFDTETKICEPNIKLTRDYRRRYLEPTRIPPAKTSEVISPPTPSTKNPIDEKVDAIAKDADDLGDWLYNQFFKTIENQVINKTETEPLTRRSGTSVLAHPVPKIRSRRRPKKKSKMRRGMLRFKKKGLKKRLLRITGDDSLFDSSDTDDTSSSSSFGSSDSSDTSLGMENHCDDKEHGHRKIVMINKKPTPALPSFIFLPNVETPFYPPIGLPPPPIIPMYPMVPIPPVIGVTPNCDKKDTTINDSTTASPSALTTTTHAFSVTTTPTTTKSTISDVTTSSPTIDPNVLRNIRNKIKKRNRKPLITPFTSNFVDPDTTFMNDLESPIPFRPPVNDDPSPLEDVNFKYLAELIHKVDLNKTKPNFIFRPNQKHENKNDFFNFNQVTTQSNPIQNPPSSDYRQLHHKLARPASKADELSEAFYGNLGKQIATLIRKRVDEGESQFDIGVEKNKNRNPMHAIFNENRFAPRSYWERFVRSSLKPGQPFTMNEDVNDFMLNGEDLLNLEDRVNVAAAFEKSFSLQELENMANTMVGKQNETPKGVLLKPTWPVSKLNQIVDNNLLPPVISRSDSGIQLQDNNDNNKQKKTVHRNTPDPNDFNIYSVKYAMYNDHNNKIGQEEFNAAKNVSKYDLATSYDFKRMKSPKLRDHQVSAIVQRNMTVPIVSIAHHIIKYQLSPMMLTHKNFNEVGNNRNYQSQQAIALPTISQHPVVKPRESNAKPSYFLNEFNYFD